MAMGARQDTDDAAEGRIHLRPTAPLADRALLMGDPGRALALAQTLIEQPRMFNHHRGLWGYSGAARLDGQPLSIQSTGMGGPSAAIVLEELISLGLRRAVRVGTCGALRQELELGDLVVAEETICADGTSRSLAAAERLAADPAITDALCRAAEPRRRGRILTTDLFYDPDPASTAEEDWRKDGAIAVEMEAAALFAVGARHGVPIGCLLTVSDVFGSDGARERIAEEALLAASQRMGTAALAALA